MGTIRRLHHLVHLLIGRSIGRPVASPGGASRPRLVSFRGTCLATGLALAGCTAAASEPPARAEAPTDPAGDRAAEPASAYYSAEQATEGQRVFTTVCAVCHGRSEFTGPIFALTWMAEPVGHLFQHITAAMPQDDPGSLTPAEYAAVVAYMLQLNGRPAGQRPLPADAELLDRLRW